MKLPFRASVELGFIAGLMIVIAVGMFAYRSNEALVDNARWVAHTHRVPEALERTSSLLKDAGTAERGFVITGNERYLEPYFDARPRIEAEVARVQLLTRDNPRQQQRLDSLAPLVTLRLARIDQIIAARRTSGSGPAISLVREGIGLRLMTAIRRDIQQLQAEETRLLAKREVATERRAHEARLAITLGSLAAVVILAAAVRILMRDLRERNRAEASARFSEARFRHLVEAADDVIYRADASGHFTYVNPVAVRITGYSEDELLGMHYLRLVHPDHRKQTQEFYARQMASGMSNTYFEVRAQGKDGREIWLGQNVRIVGGDIQIGVQAVARDITNKREVERLKSEFVSIVSHELRTPLTAIRGSLGLLASGRLGADRAGQPFAGDRNAEHGSPGPAHQRHAGPRAAGIGPDRHGATRL